MPITLDGSGSITGLSAGGLPDNTITTAELQDSAVTPAKLSQKLTLDTAKSASGTSVDFTGIPSWVRRITVMFTGLSSNSTSVIQLRLGTASGVEATGYTGATNDGGTPQTWSAGMILRPGNSGTDVYNGQYIINLLNPSTNTWAASHIAGRSDGNSLCWGGGTKSLSGTLDRIRLTTANGTDTFDAGTVNILYE